MKKIKSLLALLMAVVFIVSITGCGKSKSTTTSTNDDFFADSGSVISTDDNAEGIVASGESSQKTGATQGSSENKVGGKSWSEVLTAMPKKLRGTTIDVFNWNPVSEYGGAATAIQKFTKETGIKVNWITQDYNTYQTRLASLVASGSAPDVARTNKPLATSMRSFQPLTAANFDFSDGAWDQRVMKDYSVNGKVYATSLNNTHIASRAVMFYNKALIDKYDFENPYQLWKNEKWTWEKFISMSKEFKEVSKEEYGAGAGDWDLLSQIFGIPGPYAYDGSKYYSLCGDSNFINVTQKLADLYNTDNIIKDWGAEEFDRGELLFWAGGSIYGRRMNTYFSTLKSSGTLYCVPMPKVAGQAKYYQGLHEYEAYAIVNGAENPEAVPYFLRYFLDPANYDMNAFYSNKQALEVYEWCCKQENTIWTVGYWDKLNSMAFDNIKSMKGNQVKNFVDSNEFSINDRVKSLNDALAKLK